LQTRVNQAINIILFAGGHEPSATSIFLESSPQGTLDGFSSQTWQFVFSPTSAESDANEYFVSFSNPTLSTVSLWSTSGLLDVSRMICNIKNSMAGYIYSMGIGLGLGIGKWVKGYGITNIEKQNHNSLGFN